MSLRNSLFVSLIGHLIIFSFVTITFHVARYSQGLEFFFWGGIVRKEELTPSQSRSWDFSDGYTVSLPQSASAYSVLWGKKVTVEKSEKRRPPDGSGLPEPIKFLGPRVRLDSDKEKGEGVRPVELPAQPIIKLRYPRS